MSQNPPQTLSVKRKRTEAPVDALIVDHTVKRHKASPRSNFIFRRLTKPNDTPQQTLAPPTHTIERRYQLDATARARNRHVLVEAKADAQEQNVNLDEPQHEPAIESNPEKPLRARKRPGAGSALNRTVKPTVDLTSQVKPPTAQDVRELEALSQQVEKEDNLLIPLASPSKHKPKAPAQRFAQRHPEKAAALAAHDDPTHVDAMDIDTDEYVYDTYIREAIMPDADGKLPEPTGTVGVIMISEEDEDWWNGEDESDEKFDTDDEDENAEDYYANDYPEDELDEDDEYDRNLYQGKFRHGSDDEEYNLDDGNDNVIGSGEDEDDLHFKMTVPKTQRAGYWGAVGEAA
ncbi:hypothetical protein CC86DRAFT_373659 [Ophiobolus disseminans]|uniref:Transcription factor Iwr1 domain-containing protein n=1 Tax=Ophiobolus disseminans TaxID=1469910 RepID=A0A6A6ZK91_9PLEO|nr:hypothetical protein CC86DRAFT_373659 [Ophiobolus disseminans]